MPWYAVVCRIRPEIVLGKFLSHPCATDRKRKSNVQPRILGRASARTTGLQPSRKTEKSVQPIKIYAFFPLLIMANVDKCSQPPPPKMQDAMLYSRFPAPSCRLYAIYSCHGRVLLKRVLRGDAHLELPVFVDGLDSPVELLAQRLREEALDRHVELLGEDNC
jgi:hypothetical protein